jgi:hypothetical protein
VQIQLESLAREIKDLSEVLAYNGLNLVSQENIRQIEMFLQQASQLRLFRLATSLRYLHVELKRFITHQPAFNVERYVFFLNNCWLLSQAFLSGKMGSNGKKERHLAEICGDTSDPVDVEELELRLSGLEKVHLEGALFGIVFHFFSMNSGREKSVIKLSVLQQPKGLANPDVLLGMNIPGTDPPMPFYKLLKKNITLKKVKYLEREAQIQLGPDVKTEFFLSQPTADDEDPFPVAFFDMHLADKAGILEKMSSNEVTPFDASVFNVGYAYVKKVTIVAQRKEGENQGNYQTAVHVFDLQHERPFRLLVRIQDKQVNNALVANLGKLFLGKETIDGMFGKLVVERGTLSLFPLACVDAQWVWFPAIPRDLKFSNKDILQQLYQQKTQSKL